MKNATEYSRENLELAKRLVNDTKACAELARDTYPHRRGMWKSVQSSARKVIDAAEKNGLTSESPTVEKDGMIWALSFWGDVAFIPYSESAHYKQEASQCSS